MDREIIYTQDQLEERCCYWQKILGLQDWDIRLSIKRERDMTGTGREGECQVFQNPKIAVINFLDPLDYGNDNVLPYNMERVLIHEMTHIHLDAVNPKPTPSERQALE